MPRPDHMPGFLRSLEVRIGHLEKLVDRLWVAFIVFVALVAIVWVFSQVFPVPEPQISPEPSEAQR